MDYYVGKLKNIIFQYYPMAVNIWKRVCFVLELVMPYPFTTYDVICTVFVVSNNLCFVCI